MPFVDEKNGYIYLQMRNDLIICKKQHNKEFNQKMSKRLILEDQITTLAWGHYKIRDLVKM